MRDDPLNQTRWKHKWKWHNRGNIWDKIASDLASKEDWISKRKDKTSSADKTEFVTLVLNRMNLSTVHRKEKGRVRGKQAGLKPPGKSGPADATVDRSIRKKCDDSENFAPVEKRGLSNRSQSLTTM